MKRFIFSAIALMIAATACTESGIIDMPDFYQNPIVFDTYIGNTPVTKAMNCDFNALKLEEKNGGGAHIYGFKADRVTGRPYDYVDYSSTYLDGQLLFSSAWLYCEDGEPVEAYMPTDKDLAVVAYNLQAVGTSTAPIITNISDDKTSFDFTVQDVVAEQVDLLVTPLTFVTENTNGDTQVPLHFYHLLSRVGFKVQSSGNSNTPIIISSIKLSGTFAKKGNVDLTFATATPNASVSDKNPSNIVLNNNLRPKITPKGTETVTEYELLPGDDVIFSTTAEKCFEKAQQITPDGDNCYMMIMPGIQENAKVTITYQIGSSKPKPVEIDLAALNDINYFEAGSAYEFIFKLSTSAIEFSATVVDGADWNTPSSSDLN